MKIRHALIALVMAMTILLGLGNTAEAAAPDTVAKTELAAHPVWNAQQICEVISVGTFGPEPNGVSLRRWRTIHGFGLHWVQCCFGAGSNQAHAQYLVGWGTLEWIHGDPWCAN